MNLGHTKGTGSLEANKAIEDMEAKEAKEPNKVKETNKVKQAKQANQCPDCKRINEVLSRVGDRWSVLVVISLSQYGTLRFNALKRHLGISQRMLSLTLRELERDGLVNRTYHPTIPPKVEYNLTPMGESFQEPVRALGQWALENLASIDKSRDQYDRRD